MAEYARERIEAGVALTKVCAEIGVGHPTLVRILEQAPVPPIDITRASRVSRSAFR
jgi:hypothetical protein